MVEIIKGKKVDNLVECAYLCGKYWTMEDGLVDKAQTTDKEKINKSVRVGWYIGKLYSGALTTKVEVKKLC